MEIREATIDDALVIANIHAESWSRSYARVLTRQYLEHQVPNEREKIWKDRFSKPRPDQYVIAALIDGEIIGFACSYIDGINELGAFLDNLHVALPHQGAGIGRALLQAIALKCVESDPNRGLCLTVNQDNVPAQEFYLRLGATNIGEDLWSAPDGSIVPTYWFAWNNAVSLTRNEQG